MTINPIKSGLALGAVMALWHLTWSLLVALGWAQSFIDFVFWIHFIKPVYVVQPFNPATAAILIGVTAAIGFAVGVVFAVLWNWFHKRP
jgi:hypothetical protein